MIEFSVITGLCLSRIRELKQGLDYELGAVAIAMGAGAAVWLLSIAPALTHDAAGRIAITLNDAPLRQFEAAEYLPRGYGSRAGGLPDYENDPLPGVPTISCEPAAIVCRAKELPFGELMIEIESQAATTAVLRRFSFPTVAHRARAPDLRNRRPKACVVHCAAEAVSQLGSFVRAQQKNGGEP